MPIHSLNGPEHAWICRHDGESWKHRQLSGRSPATGQPERFLPWLGDLGHRFYGYDVATRSPSSERSTEGRLNIFALHPESPNAVTGRLGGMIR